MSENTARNSVWYGRWMKMLEWLETDPPKEEILRKLDTELDKRHAYGSKKNAYVASSALDRAIEDHKRMNSSKSDKESMLLKLASCCWSWETVGKNVVLATNHGIEFDEKVDKIFKSLFRSLSRKEYREKIGNLADKAINCLSKLDESKKTKKLERAKSRWMAKALKDE